MAYVRWTGTPRQRVAMLQESTREEYARDWKAIRHAMILAEEVGYRLACQSFKGTWKQVISGLRCYGAFHTALFPESPHFPMCGTAASAFAAIFQNAGTLGQYMSHVRKGEEGWKSLLVVPPSQASNAILTPEEGEAKCKEHSKECSWNDVREMLQRTKPSPPPSQFVIRPSGPKDTGSCFAECSMEPPLETFREQLPRVSEFAI